MNTIPGNIAQQAFGKDDHTPLTQEEQDICEEWTSGKALTYMQIGVEDPRFFEYLGLYIKWKDQTDAVWERVAANYAITPQQQEAPVVYPETRRIGKRTWLLAAAVLTASIVGVYSLYRFLNNNQIPTDNTVVATKTVEAGKEQAFLTLADDKKINLDTTPAGVIAYQDQMEISKQGDNQIVYKASDKPVTGTQVLSNSLTIPYGREYKVLLADGSTVWLNAGSSLRYPAAFKGNDRPVEISGEGYFEVAEDKTKPFRVFANGTEVKVLGTKFNVKAYNSDEQVTATLVNGAVAIQHGKLLKNIKPNQQAIVFGDSIKIDNKSKEEMTQVLAWKNGLINLNGESLASILQQIERWYNVKTKIEAGTPETTLTGTIEKSTPLPNALELLNTNVSVQFTLDGHTVVARKKSS